MTVSNDEDPVRQRSTHATSGADLATTNDSNNDNRNEPAPPSGVVNFSSAIRAANEDEDEQAPERSPALRFLSFLVYLHHLLVKLALLGAGSAGRRARGLFHRNPSSYRHIITPRYTSMAVLEANSDDARPPRLGVGCWISDATLFFTYQDFCGFCGSPMTNRWSTPAIIEGVVVSAAPPGWEDNMGHRHRVLLIIWEVSTFAGMTVSVVVGVVAYLEQSATMDTWLSSAAGALNYYWLTFWQPRLGLLTHWGVIGRLVIQMLNTWIATTSAMNWALMLVLFLVMFRIAVPQ